MAPAFSKEAILQGSIDYLCLACESYLRSERDVCQHVSTAGHRQNLDNTDYVDKYRNDRIKRVKKRYFCEICNVLLSTTTAVGLHVQETRHEANKLQMIARVDDMIVIGNIAISDKAWHGFIDDNTCTICDVEYEDQDAHKSETTHVINLIQSKVSDENYYRRIDDSAFHCLTCNEGVAEITAHLDDTKHKQMLKQNINTTLTKQEGSKKNIQVTQTHDEDFKFNAKSVNDIKKQSSDILDCVPNFQKNNIDINFESCTAVCRRCSMNLEFNCNEIETHIEEHKNNAKYKTMETEPALFERDDKNKTTDNGKVTNTDSRSTVTENINTETNSMTKTKQNCDVNIVQKTAEEHGLTYITTGNKVYCQLCDKNIKSSDMHIVSHVKSHKSERSINSKNNQITKINKKQCTLTRVPFIYFFERGEVFKTLLADDVIFNNCDYCIDFLSFYYLTKAGPGRIRCQICEVNLHVQDVMDHVNVERHNRAMNEVPILIELSRTDSELIREIRSGIFQCGYCNIYDSWEGMEDHLKSADHNEEKTFANRRLSQHLRRRLERHIQENFLQLLLS